MALSISANTCVNGAIECLDGLVGLRQCQDVALTCPTSGLFLDDVYGLDYQFLSNYLNQTEEDLPTAFKKIRSNASHSVLNDVFVRVNKIRNLTLKTATTGLKIASKLKAQNVQTFMPTEAMVRGIRVSQRRTTYSLEGTLTPINKLFIKSIGIHAKNQLVIAVKLYDLDTVTTYYVRPTGGGVLAKLDINYTAKSDTVYIAYDAMQDEVLENTLVSGCSNCGATSNCGSIYFKPFISTSGVPNGVVEGGSNCYGLYVDSYLTCDQQTIICGISQFLATTMLYKLAVDVVRYAYTSSRLGAVNMDKETLDEMVKMYSAEYENAICASVSSIVDYLCSLDRCCIQVNGIKLGHQRI